MRDRLAIIATAPGRTPLALGTCSVTAAAGWLIRLAGAVPGSLVVRAAPPLSAGRRVWPPPGRSACRTGSGVG